MSMLDLLGLFIFISGFVIGLGAVTVIDIHGFLGRKSEYWTEATTRTHKVTKPLIWIGIFLAVVGGAVFYRAEPFVGIPLIHTLLVLLLVLNGLFLTFGVSSYLLEREKRRQSSQLLPGSWQKKIICSFIISDFGWWGGLLLLVYYLVSK